MLGHDVVAMPRSLHQRPHSVEGLNILLGLTKEGVLRGKNEALRRAAIKGYMYLNTVMMLLDGGADTDEMDKSGRCALVNAAQFGHVKVVQALLKRGARTDVAASDKLTALHFAARNGHLEVCRKLLDHGANIDAMCGNGLTALIEAIQAGHTFTVGLLLTRNADVGPVDAGTWSMQTPLHIAAKSGGYEMVSQLLERGSCVDAADADGMTPLMVAAAAGHEPIIERLVQVSARVQARSSYGDTALHFAAAKGHLLACTTLLLAGADIDASNSYGITPLMDATKRGHLLLFHQLVVKADITAQQQNGYTVMHVAASVGAVRAMERLLRIEGGQSLLEMGNIKPLTPPDRTPKKKFKLHMQHN